MAARGWKWPKPPRTDSRVVLLLLVMAALFGARAWLAEHPWHDPWAPLDLNHPRGWATESKLASLREDAEECRAVLARSGVEFASLDPAGEGQCRRTDRLRLTQARLRPADAQLTCPVAVGTHMWIEKDVQPLAMQLLGSPVSQVQQIGTYSCRRIYGAATGRWSEHAAGNAIDISGFLLENGERISVLSDWGSEGPAGRFLRGVRDAACLSFGTVLSPDYNEAHADHFHFDQGRSPRLGVCR